MNKVFEKIIEKQEELFQDLNVIEVLSHVDFDSTIQNSLENFLKAITNEAIEIVKQEAEKYEECYKDCGDCEAYNKEKHHCPKFCKVIKETVKEIEENHNGWIPCSERMPEDEQVVITCKYKSISILRYSTKTNHWYELNGNWWWSANMVTAWQPLPQPYQPKGE